MAPKRPQSRKDFEIALVCALKAEADALQATAIFDKFWGFEDNSFDLEPSNDTNSYTTGVIGEHNVVLLRLPRMGRSSSSGAMASLYRSFTGIKLTLVVGICGAVPTIFNGSGMTEIHLGDLVYSTAVIQYDFGRQNADKFVRKSEAEDNLARVDLKVAGVLNKLETERQLRILQERVSVLVGAVQRELPRTAHPGRAKDFLFRPDYQHRHHYDCQTCTDSTQEQCKHALEATCEELQCETNALARTYGKTLKLDHTINIHFGRVGSADTIMRSGIHRNVQATEHRLIAFEMEAAGVWDYGPSLVIKGVSDYADAHKDKNWQAYASAVAAAGTKAFLEHWVPSEKPRQSSFSQSNDRRIEAGPNSDAISRRTKADNMSSTRDSKLQACMSNTTAGDLVTSTQFPLLNDQSSVRKFRKITDYRNLFLSSDASSVKRKALIKLINEKFALMLDTKKIITLWGLTGSGKTQLAQNYVREFADSKYALCLKIQGRSNQEIQHGLAAYARKLKLISHIDLATEEMIGLDSPILPDPEEKSAQAMIEWLNLEGNSQWVLLVDDVEPPKSSGQGIEGTDYTEDEDEFYLAEVIDQLEQGTIVLTSQYSTIDEMYPGLEVKGFDFEQSLQLLQRKLTGCQYSHESYVCLIGHLEGHPQAIDCAASYMRRYRCSPERYLELWNACDKQIFNYKPVIKGIKSLAVTLKLAFEKLDTHSQFFLKLWCFLDSTSIDFNLLQEQNDINREGDAMSHMDLVNEAIRQIGDLSLLVARPQSEHPSRNDTICIHPAVQKVVQSITIGVGEEFFPNQAICIIGRELAKSLHSEYSMKLSDLVPHIQQALENLKLLKRNDLELIEDTLPSIGRIGQYFHRRGQLHLAIRLYDKALRRYSMLGRTTEDYYIIVNSRGLACQALGNFEKAQKCFESVLRYHNTNGTTGSSNFAVIGARTHLALSLKNRGELEAAKTMLVDVLQTYQNLDQKHPEYFQQYRLKQYIGDICRDEGDLEGAESFHLDACFGLQLCFGTNSAYVYFAKRQLALTYGFSPYQEKRNLGLQELEAARVGLLEFYGADSAHDLDIARSFAHLKRLDWEHRGSDQSSVADVLDLHSKLAQRHEAILGSFKPMTLATILDWADLLYHCGQMDAASKTARKALTGYRSLRSMPREGYDTFILLARCLWRLGHTQENPSLLRQALNLFDEARQMLDNSKIGTTATGYSLCKIIAVERAAICAEISSPHDICSAMMEVLSLRDITEGQQRWAQSVLDKAQAKLHTGSAIQQ